MNQNPCPRCGAEVGADAPDGLCPACLLKAGLAPDAPPDEPLEGDPLRKSLAAKLGGQYRIVRLLGRGGMGSVYLARDLSLDREVAIKVVKADGGSAEVHHRFRREAKTAARLSHPHIVPLHAFGEVEGMPYFVMGYVRGESLAARLEREGRLPEEEARRVLAEIADALDHAHRQGVVHRDVKPDNVLLEDEAGRALLTDFGVAKALGRNETMTSLGSVLGTPAYMSPEQAAGRAGADGRSDLYSLGVMGFEMLAGRLPFEGGTAAEVLRKHLTEEPPPLRAFAPATSEATALAVSRCLVKEPEGRWPDARSLRLALGRVEESQLPDALQSVEATGFPTLLVCAAILLPLWALFYLPGVLKVVQVASLVFIYLFAVRRLVREGFTLRESQTVIWREPSWWPAWYPRALRRRGNVWDRLPRSVRLLRTSIVAVVVPGLLGPMSALMGVPANVYTHPVSFAVVVGSLGVVVALFAYGAVSARKDLFRKGLGPADAERVALLSPPSRVGFWSRPHIAAVLAPAPDLDEGRRAGSPHDQLQSILRNAGELAGPLRPLGGQAASAARQLLAAIDEAERRIADLARNLEPGEEERLAERIEALGGDEEQAPLRELLEKQLELIRGLTERIEEARALRSRRVEMLKTLALHVASLKARSGEPTGEVRSLSDRVRTLCDDIGQQSGEAPEGVPTITLAPRS